MLHRKEHTQFLFYQNIHFYLFAYSAKGFQHHRMTNGAMNVEIGNPAYKIYEGDPDDDAGELLDSDFALDPDKVSFFFFNEELSSLTFLVPILMIAV